MSINKFHKDKFFTRITHELSASGVIGEQQYEVLGENILRVVSNFTSSGVLAVEAKIKYSSTWDNLGTLIAGGDNEQFDISSYDFIRFNFTTPAGSSGEVGASGFFKGSTLSTSGAGFDLIQTDSGTPPASDSSNSTLTFTSTDGSVIVEGDASTDTIDFRSNATSQNYFEEVSKNIRSWNYALNYTSGALSSIVYTNATDTITKTFNYTGDNLTSIVLSGDTPSGIDLTKTLTYTSGNLSGVAYT